MSVFSFNQEMKYFLLDEMVWKIFGTSLIKILPDRLIKNSDNLSQKLRFLFNLWFVTVSRLVNGKKIHNWKVFN